MEFESRILKIFNPLRSERGSLPSVGIMKETLGNLAPSRRVNADVPANRSVIRLFASASVEMWLRSVHSFLISASLTDVSHLWASVAGYYSSHYTIRAIAHLLGLYHLRQKRFTVILQPSGSGFICQFRNGRNNREHLFYWNRVKQDSYFSSNDLFTENKEDAVFSDAGHRNFATYIDHLNRFANYSLSNISDTITRIEKISKTGLSSYPIPSKDNYPDINSVQVVAYHRIVFYRELLDEVLGNSNRFWNVYRDPNWCRDIIKFQRVKLRVYEQ